MQSRFILKRKQVYFILRDSNRNYIKIHNTETSFQPNKQSLGSKMLTSCFMSMRQLTEKSPKQTSGNEQWWTRKQNWLADQGHTQGESSACVQTKEL